MPFEITVGGVNELLRDVTDTIKRLDNPRPALLAIIKDFHQIEQEQFASQGARGGRPWKPLAPATVARKRQQGFPTAILVARGTLRRSLTQRGARYSRTTIRRSSLELGTADPVAAVHQFGWGVPQREVIVITANDRRRWVEIVRQYAVGLR